MTNQNKMPYHKEIRELIEGWYKSYPNETTWDNIRSLQQTSIQDARGITFLDRLTKEYELNGTEVYFRREGLFDILIDVESHLKQLIEQGIKPTHYLFDCSLVGSYSNCYAKYLYSFTFLQDSKVREEVKEK